MTDKVYLELSGGWVHVDELRWAETHADGLVVALASKERPIVLKGEDRALVEAYLHSRRWQPLSTREEPVT